MTCAWRPSSDLSLWRARARLLAEIRFFFQEKEVLEVETPLLCHATGSDPHLDFFTTHFHASPELSPLYLQTSPEFAMKRLLAAGSGSIYQICKAFRNGEIGRFHNPEFTILEWYRVGFSLTDLMDEVAALLNRLLKPHVSLQPVHRVAYQDIFIVETGLDPLSFQFENYCNYAERHGLSEAAELCGDDHATWLDFIFSHEIQPALGSDSICLVHGYPAVFSSLARISEEDSRVAERFEVFFRGVELSNGFCELTDSVEQEKRFDREIATRQLRQQPMVQKDQRFLAALHSGLPDCSGVAIGLDRLLMIMLGCESIDDVLTFPINIA